MLPTEKKSGNPATIKDIARKVGISPSTVSRFFSGKVPVSSETSDLILSTAQELGYQINRTARRLVMGHNQPKAVGVLLPLMTHPFFNEILRGINQAFLDTPYNLMIFNLGSREEEVFQRILDEGLSGLLVVSHALPEKILTLLSYTSTPIVFLDYEHPKYTSFTVQHRAGGQLAAKHLLAKGCSHPLYVGETTTTPQQDQRLLGFTEELLRSGLKSEVLYTQQGAETTRDLLLKAWEHEPHYDGLFCYCDEMAYGALEALHTLGLEVPLVGFDDLLPSRYLHLTTVAQPAVELGLEGSRCLIKGMENSGTTSPSCVLTPKLVVRNT